jgi:hypothetical protein
VEPQNLNPDNQTSLPITDLSSPSQLNPQNTIQPSPFPPNPPKKFPIKALLGIILIFVLVVIAFLFTRNLPAKNAAISQANPSSSIIPTISPASNPTLNWKTFSNKDFQINYPAGWLVGPFTPDKQQSETASKSGEILIASYFVPEDPFRAIVDKEIRIDFAIHELNQDTNETLEKYVSSLDIVLNALPKKLSQEEIKIDNYPAIKITSQLTTDFEGKTVTITYIYYHVQVGNQVYSISYNSNPQNQDKVNIAELIIRTLKFTPKPTPNQTTDLWQPYCDQNNIDTLNIPVVTGNSITEVARSAVGNYFINRNLNNPQQVQTLTAEEKIYAEDFITKKLNQKIVPNTSVPISCKLIEEAAIKARLLTISQKQNLKTYSQRVSNLQIQQWLQDILDSTTPPGGLQPILIPVGH